MPHARHTDPITSHEAAGSVDNVNQTQKFILSLLMLLGPMPDETLVAYYQMQRQLGADVRDVPVASESGIRSRRAELVRLGLVKDSGERIRLRSGRRAIIWQAV